VSLTLIPESEFLDIKVENTLTLEKYSQLIDPNFISQRENLNCFADPISIFEYLVSAFDKVVVEDGAMKFLYVWGTVKKREREIAIELVKEEMDRL
jgi:hypothetical protein